MESTKLKNRPVIENVHPPAHLAPNDADSHLEVVKSIEQENIDSIAPIASESIQELDPVCGMPVSRDVRPMYSLTYKGKRYLFCSRTCEKSFVKNSRLYVKR